MSRYKSLTTTQHSTLSNFIRVRNYTFILPSTRCQQICVGPQIPAVLTKAQRFPAEIGPAQSAAFMIKIWWRKTKKTNICSGRQLLLTSFFFFLLSDLCFIPSQRRQTRPGPSAFQTASRLNWSTNVSCWFCVVVFFFFLKKCVPHMETSLWFLFFPLTPSWSLENCWLYSQIGKKKKNSSCVCSRRLWCAFKRLLLFIWFCVRALRNAPSL